MQPIVNDFFCGCGGMGVGFLNAGYKIAGAWDFDKYAVQSYDHNVGHHVKQADIKEMTWQDVPFAHVWAFGFPCQDLSVAGKQAGLLLKCKIATAILLLIRAISRDRQPARAADLKTIKQPVALGASMK